MMVKLRVWREHYTGLIQIEIGDEEGGYRIAGPKFTGSAALLKAKTLDARDVKEIQQYLAKVESV